MFELLCSLTGLVFIGGALYAYNKTRDGLHPTIVLAPLFTYIYVSGPILTSKALEDFFSREELTYVAGWYLAMAVCLYVGLLRGVTFLKHAMVSSRAWTFLQLPLVRRRIMFLAMILGLVAVAAYIYSLVNVGGFFKAYGRAKGGGLAESGYLKDAILLSFPAIILLALSRKGLPLRTRDLALALLFAMPHLLHGTFGGRRGPLFLIVCLLFIAWYVAKGKTPSLRTGVIAVCIAGLAVVVVWSQRRHLYLGSDAEFDSGAFVEKVFAETPDQGSTYVSGAATVLTADYTERYYWGYRYFVTLFVRPIPKQIWPTKYEDMGADWLYRYGDEERELRYLGGVGFRLYGGSAPGAFADAYMEFWWGAPILFFVIGSLYAKTWRMHRSAGGLWTVFFCVMLVLSIYLATQSVTAWATRLLYISIFTYLVWRFWLRAFATPLRIATPRPRYFPSPRITHR